MPRLIDEDEAKEVFADYYHIRTEIQQIALEEAFSRVPTVKAIPIEAINEFIASRLIWQDDATITVSEDIACLIEFITEWGEGKCRRLS